jgi:three-Cys-motif partner protein
MNFFSKQAPHSRIKSEIIAQYVPTWASIILGSRPEVLYLDFFAGPGQFDDGSQSTPLLLLPKLIASKKLRAGVNTWFSDTNAIAIERLRSNVAAIAGVDQLAFPPVIEVQRIDDEIASELEDISMMPTFAFLDPFGYRGLSAKLVGSIVKDPGSECLFFFNYNRISPAIGNPKVVTQMAAIFGAERSRSLRESLHSAASAKREEYILRALREAMAEEAGGRYVLPFRFVNGGRTTHHLVFVTKHFLGFKIMRDIMARCSSSVVESVPSFEFVEHADTQTRLDLFPRTPLTDLCNQLRAAYQGKSIPFGALFEEHSADKRYIRQNYCEALFRLTQTGVVRIHYPVKPQPAGAAAQLAFFDTAADDAALRRTIPDDALIEF